MDRTTISRLSDCDVDTLLRSWPDALACPVWRLWGESPSAGLLDELRSAARHEWIVRDEGGQAVGLLEVRELSEAARSGYFSFLLPPPTGSTRTPVTPFLHAASKALGLRKVTVMADEDMLDALADLMAHLRQVGLLRQHTLVTHGRYVDRHVFEFTLGEVGAG